MMSQSEIHRQLVIQAAAEIELRYPGLPIITDVQQNPGDTVPPVIDGFRPDVYGGASSDGPTLIAEAKTDNDLDNGHTEDQITAFVGYLERRGNGLFILAVTGSAADHAKTLLRFAHQNTGVTRTKMSLFDSLDFWVLATNGRYKWLLD